MLEDLTLLRDAMRFGRPLTWPLSPVKKAPEQRVGPKLNVARGEVKEEKVKKSIIRLQKDVLTKVSSLGG